MIRKIFPTAGLILALGAAYACGTDTTTTAPSGQASASEPASSFNVPDPSGRNGWVASDSMLADKNDDRGLQPSDTALINPGVDTVLVLKRTFNLASDISKSAVIGPGGGELRIDAVGVKIDFPAGALRENTTITMTAKAGWNVAFEFAPHGITFDKPVKIQQDLKYTLAYKVKDAKDLTAGYYQADINGIFLDRWKFFARVSELRHAALDHPVSPRVAKFYIYHFSGYLMSSGFKGGGLGGGNDWDR